MLSSSGASLWSWQGSIAPDALSILIWFLCSSPTTLSYWRAPIAWYTLTVTQKSQIHIITKAQSVGCEPASQALTKVTVWPSSGSTIAPTQCDGYIAQSRTYTDFHNRAFTVLIIVFEPRCMISVAISSDCNIDDLYWSRSNTWWLSMRTRSFLCKITHK